MSNRRGKTQARRSGGNGALPGWAWLVIGVLVTLLAVLLVPRLLRGDADGFFRPKANPDALPAPVADGDAIAPDTAPPGTTPKPAGTPKDKTQYDFYTLLPGEGVQMSDAEIAASARAETLARQREAQRAAAAASAAGTTGDDLPDPVDTAPPAPSPAPTAAAPAAPATTPAKPATSVSAAPAAAPAPVPAPAPAATPKPVAAASAATGADTRYLLQAGAFAASGDAEAVKARIALLGLNARVESAQIGGKTVYRVRMGPYGSASELSEAKAKLSGGGLPAMAVKAN